MLIFYNLNVKKKKRKKERLFGKRFCCIFCGFKVKNSPNHFHFIAICYVL